MTHEEIMTPRLVLWRMPKAFLEASLRDDIVAARQFVDLNLYPEWFDEKSIIRIRLEDLKQDAAYSDWSLRAIGLRSTREMVGHIGFHSAPDPPYLRPWARDAIEFGYTVYEPFRACGYAQEAAAGLIRWARRASGVSRFVVTVSPENKASQAIAAKLGFRKIGEHLDEVDGLEEVLLLEGSALETLIEAPDAPAGAAGADPPG